MKKRGVFLGVLVLLAAACLCLLVVFGWAIWPRRAPLPVVKIILPPSGAQVTQNARVPILVQAEIAAGNLRRLSLYADAQLIGNLPTKAASLQALWSWTALMPGDHTLVAQAVSAKGETASTSVRVQVIESPDADGDGIPDEGDRCPEQKGSLETDGCPTASADDRDGDSIADSVDRCPDEYGVEAYDGCPFPSDRDGDGLADSADACPDEPGPVESGGCPSRVSGDRDGDGVGDLSDLCPEEGGTLDSGGCPPLASGDRDGDGILDDMDSCPDLAGDLEHDGCPYVTEEDRDGDGVADDADSCPDEPGSEALGGCPLHIPPPSERMAIPFCLRFPAICEALGTDSDTDGDGVGDRDDRCPEEYGLPAADGCPIMAGWRREAAGSRALLCMLLPEACGLDAGPEVNVTIDLAENLYTDRDWLAVWCYFSGEDGVWYRLPLEDPSLRRREPQIWYLGEHRSVTISIRQRSLLAVHAFCEALEAPFGEPQSLGQIVRIHSAGDWNGIPYMIWSEGSANRFMIIYTMRCSGCE